MVMVDGMVICDDNLVLMAIRSLMNCDFTSFKFHDCYIGLLLVVIVDGMVICDDNLVLMAISSFMNMPQEPGLGCFSVTKREKNRRKRGRLKSPGSVVSQLKRKKNQRKKGRL